jgi:hypothetical protein
LPNASLEADFFANFGLDSKTQGEDNSQEDGFKKPMVYHARRWRCEIPKVKIANSKNYFFNLNIFQ